ncbi:DUF6306 domain-containing protein (plasmid) [Novosphingobium sp. BL-8A]|uniref:DUF6306 domain-containing protein n=1 Tax=Novosphingobium sp. BL-8A TaxID=3127639 RepID=UPI0037583FFA
MTDQPSSSPCYASQGADAYMGYASRDELLAALNELLEAERAGARVASASAKALGDSDFSQLMERVRSDEAHWRAMLAAHIRRLGAMPSRRTGAFFEKAMEIADPLERLAFLNRGQAWVVRKLDILMPRVRDDSMHADLQEMAARHRSNIDLAQRFGDEKRRQVP